MDCNGLHAVRERLSPPTHCPWWRPRASSPSSRSLTTAWPTSPPKPELEGTNVKSSQFKQPYLEFSGSCAGCAETSYARLVTQLYGDPHVRGQRHRLLVDLG